MTGCNSRTDGSSRGVQGSKPWSLPAAHGWLTLLAIVGVLSGCSAPQPYLPDYRYAPSPALVEIFQKGDDKQTPPVTVLASIAGIRRDGKKEAPPAVEIRMKFENRGKATMAFDSSTLNLVSGTLQPFNRPEIHGPPLFQLAPGQDETIGIFFPFPTQSGPKLSGVDTLRLTWQIQLNGQTIPQTAYFERASPLYYQAQ